MSVWALSNSEEAASKLRVLLIGTVPPPVDGQSVAFDMLVSGLPKYCHAAIVDISKKSEQKSRRIAEIARALVETGRILQIGKPDLAYLQLSQSRPGFLRDFALITLIAISRTPLVLHLHGGNYDRFYQSEPRPLRAVIRAALGRSKAIIVLSEFQKRQFDFLGQHSPTIVAIRNGSPVPVSGPRRAPQGDIHLLYLSNLIEEKGYLDAIEAVRLLKSGDHAYPVKLTLAGAVPYGFARGPSAVIAEMEHRIKAAGLETCVSYVGKVAAEEKLALLDRSDIILLPTYYKNEGQPLAIIEGLSRGLPAVTTAWRDLADMVKDEVNGLVVKPKNPQTIADAVIRFRNDASLYEDCSREAIREADRYSGPAHVGAVMKLFQDVVDFKP